MGSSLHGEECLERIQEHIAAAGERHGKLLELMAVVEAQSAVVARAAAEVDRVRNSYRSAADPLAEIKGRAHVEQVRILMGAVARGREEIQALERAYRLLTLEQNKLLLMQRGSLNLATEQVPGGLALDDVQRLAALTVTRRTGTGGWSALQLIGTTEAAAEGVEHGKGGDDAGEQAQSRNKRMGDAVWRRHIGVTEAVVKLGCVFGDGGVHWFFDGDQRARDMGCGPVG